MSKRTTTLVLLILDFGASIVVFNLMSHARGALEQGRIILIPLIPPIAALVLSIYLVQGYRARTDMLSVDYASQHAIAISGALIATLLLTYVFAPTGFEFRSSRFAITLSFLVLAPLTLSYRRLLYLRTASEFVRRNIVFVGDRASGESFCQECRDMGVTQRVIYSVATSDTSTPFGTSDDGELRPFAEVLEDVQQGRVRVEAIVLRESARELAPEISRRLVQLYFAGVPTFTLELFHEVYWQKIPLYRLNQTWLFQEGFQIAREPVFERAKRITDIALSTIGLVATFPIIALSALVIWCEDRGPVLFRQVRIGKNHAPFKLIKLRTMKAGAGGPSYTQPGDSRITRAGRILRATRFDELPQLWNVLCGHMSMIGPRAEWDRLVADYEQQIPCYHFRHLVRPGITGWAQVNYPYGANIEDTMRKLEYDLYYIRHFCFRLDATIVLKTIHVMLFGKGR